MTTIIHLGHHNSFFQKPTRVEIDLALPEVIPPIRRLYAQGNLELLKSPLIGIVGSRNASTQGLLDAHWFGHELAAHAIGVVSGLAVGIDTAAHEGVLRGCSGRAIAVLAHGLDTVYPHRNRGLLKNILAAGGLVLTEYPSGVKPLPYQFVHRNRIIAAISKAICVIEAHQKSGALITATAALEMGRDVYAMPGSIHSRLSDGPHLLIRQGAGLVRSPRELLSDMGLLKSSASGMEDPSQVLNGRYNEGDVISRVLSYYPESVHSMAGRSGIPVQQLLPQLLAGELKGVCQRLPNGDWVRIRNFS